MRIWVIRTQIHSVTQTAADENRKLTESEIENIKDLYNELAQITSTQGDVEASAAWERMISRAYTYDSYDVLLEEIGKAREKSEASLEDIEEAQYKLMASQILDRRANGASEDEIETFRNDFTKSIENSLNEKRKQILEYEHKLLMAFREARYGDIEKTAFDDAYNDYFSSDEEKEKLKQYYELIKSLQQSGAGQDEVNKIVEIINSIGDTKYIDAIASIGDAVESTDETYREWGDEITRVSSELDNLGYSGAIADDVYTGLADILEGFEGLDIDDILPGSNEISERLSEYSEIISEWEKGQNKYSSYSPPQSSFVGPQLPIGFTSAGQGTKLEVKIYDNDKQIAETQMPLGTDAKMVVDNGKSSWGGR